MGFLEWHMLRWGQRTQRVVLITIFSNRRVSRDESKILCDRISHSRRLVLPPHLELAFASRGGGGFGFRDPMSGPVLVPTIDFGGFEGPDSVAHARVVSQLATACQDVGFFLVVNHGIDETVLSDALSVSRCFFHLPLRQKMRVANTKKGYIPVGGCENAVRPSSLHEKFSCGPVDFDKTDEYYAGTDGDPRAELFFGEPNLWPSEPTSFERKYAKYYRECTEFTARLHRGFAEALGVPTDYFESKSTKHVSNLVALRYPPVADAERTQKEKTRTSPEDTQTRLLVKPHTDPTDLTVLLFEHGPCGLQVLPDGAGETWVDVPAVKNSLLGTASRVSQIRHTLWRPDYGCLFAHSHYEVHPHSPTRDSHFPLSLTNPKSTWATQRSSGPTTFGEAPGAASGVSQIQAPMFTAPA